MKSIVECINEALFKLSNKSLALTWDLIDICSADDTKEAIDELGMSASDSKFYEGFTDLIKKIGTINTYEFEIPGLDMGVEPTPEDLHDALLDMDIIKPTDNGFILNQDGDGPMNTVCVFNKRLSPADDKKLQDYLDVYKNHPLVVFVSRF